MTLRSQMISDVNSLLLNTDEHAETISLLKGGDQAFASDVTAIVNRDVDSPRNLPLIIGDDRGEQRQRWCQVMMSTDTAVDIDERSNKQDQFLIDGQRWFAIYIETDGFGMQTVWATRTEPVTTRKNRL